MNFIDKAIAVVAPQTALKRAKARYAIRAYEGASVGRRASSWKTLHTSANAELQQALRPLRDRARDLVRNTPHAVRILDIITSYTVGEGIIPVPATGSDRLDRQVAALWEDWVKQSDVTGVLNFYAIQALAVRSMVESGDVALRFIDRSLDDNGLAVPMQVQLLEADYVDNFRDGIYGDYGVDKSVGLIRSRLGVGLGDFDRRVGLWLWPYHPGEITTMNMRPLLSTFVKSDDVAFMLKVQRPGQVRGVPWLAPILTTARDTADFVDAVNVKARVEACFSAFITNDDLNTPLMDPSQAGINQTFDPANPTALVTTLEPGMMKELRAGQDIKFAQPTSNTQIEPMLLYNLQAMASGVGLTYEQISGDPSRANYSSLRAGGIHFWRLVGQLQQHTLIPMLCEPTWNRFISRAILAGRLKPRRGGYPCQWVTPAREAVDPQKDLDAEKNEVRSGRITPQAFIASKGGNWRTDMADRAAFNKLTDELGITLDIDPRRTDQSGRLPTAGITAPGDMNTSKAAIADESEDLDANDDSADD
jgi:lambda family phage portal protein